MGASRIFTSEDIGAPVLHGLTNGSLNALLLACLVNGYGGKEPLGWTCPFYDNSLNVYVFRNNPVQGSGMFLRVGDGGTSLMYEFTLRAYASMGNIHSGISPIPLNGYSINKKGYGQAANIPWKLIGDDRGFYLFTRNGNAYWAVRDDYDSYLKYEGLYVGDIISSVANTRILYGIFGNASTLSGIHFPSDCGVAMTTQTDNNQFSMINKNPVTGKLIATSVRVLPLIPSSSTAVGSCNQQSVITTGIPHCADTAVIANWDIVGKLPGMYSPIVNWTLSQNKQLFAEKYFSYGPHLFLFLPLLYPAVTATYDMTMARSVVIKIGDGFRV